jgi:hypothetical protein
MKRGILAVALLAVSGLANAGLSFNQLSTANRTEAFNVATLPFYAVGTSVGLGALQTNEKGTITFTYIGQESGFNNKFYLTIGATQMLTENPIGTQASAFVDTIGAISYKFEGNTGKFAINGGAWATGTSIGLIGTNMTVNSGAGAGTYQYVIGYNDSAGASTLGDWDDYVVGVNFTPAIPEPEIYAMMGLGLGLIGWVGRRRKQLAA